MLKSLLVVSLLVISTLSMAKSVDWTPYLQGMQNGCKYDLGAIGIPSTSEDGYTLYNTKKASKNRIPKALQSSVSTYQTTFDTQITEDRNGDIIKLNLKNATFLGQPITGITYKSMELWAGFGSELTVNFANNNFTKLAPKFYLVIGNQKFPVGKNAYFLINNPDDEKPTAKSITLKQFNKSREETNAKTTATGWEYSGGGTNIHKYLTFNTKTKSIVCYNQG